MVVIAEKTANSVTSQAPHSTKQARSGSPRGRRRLLARPHSATAAAAGISQPVSRPRSPRSSRSGAVARVGGGPVAGLGGAVAGLGGAVAGAGRRRLRGGAGAGGPVTAVGGPVSGFSVPASNCCGVWSPNRRNPL